MQTERKGKKKKLWKNSSFKRFFFIFYLFIFQIKNYQYINKDELKKKRELEERQNPNETRFRLNYEKNLKKLSIRTDRKVSKRV